MSRSLTREIARACAVCRDQHAAGDIEAARATARYIADDIRQLFEQLDIAFYPWLDEPEPLQLRREEAR